jgi:hypothetical protein
LECELSFSQSQSKSLNDRFPELQKADRLKAREINKLKMKLTELESTQKQNIFKLTKEKATLESKFSAIELQLSRA